MTASPVRPGDARSVPAHVLSAMETAGLSKRFPVCDLTDVDWDGTELVCVLESGHDGACDLYREMGYITDPPTPALLPDPRTTTDVPF